jgi:hypothetical protein
MIYLQTLLLVSLTTSFSSAMATVVDAVAAPRCCILLLFILLLLGVSVAEVYDPHLGTKRVVFQTKYGDIEFGFYPKVAPKTVDHIFKLVRLGAYNTNHFFRVIFQPPIFPHRMKFISCCCMMMGLQHKLQQIATLTFKNKLA